MNSPFDAEALRETISRSSTTLRHLTELLKNLVTGESTHTKSDLDKTLMLFNPLHLMAVDTPHAPQMCRKPTEEAVFDGCMERFRPIMMTTGQRFWK
jgi:hypothetical protein